MDAQLTHCSKSPKSSGCQLRRVTPVTPQPQPIKHLKVPTSNDRVSVKPFSPSFPERLTPSRETSLTTAQTFSPPCGESFFNDRMTLPKETYNPLRAALVTPATKSTFCFKPPVKQSHSVGDTSSVDSYMTSGNCHQHSVDSYDSPARAMSPDTTVSSQRDSLSDMLADDDDLPSITGPPPKTPPTSHNNGMLSFCVWH